MEINDIRTSVALEDAGVELPFGDAKVTLRSTNSEIYKKGIREILKPHETSISLNLLSDEKMRELLDLGTARGLIVSWSGFTSGGQDFPYSEENALSLLKIASFRNFVEANVSKIDNFRDQREAAERKNS